MRRDIKFLTEFVIWLCGAVRNFIRDVRRLRSTRTKCAYHAEQREAISRLRKQAYHESQRLSISCAAELRHITMAKAVYIKSGIIDELAFKSLRNKCEKSEDITTVEEKMNEER